LIPLKSFFNIFSFLFALCFFSLNFWIINWLFYNPHSFDALLLLE
jgi:hypothetical protein